ncbi:hypothetical protein EXN66_Car018299 [Channa argus]|uniref:Uncharacterized protein n=1 Tax=Channa argus TaxID=215402 RepID=A0A6G1QIV7_CHAAH|nr:hypothetical protein EXN66_Car018299 [Channa argus]
MENIMPALKVLRPSVPSDYRPVALTSHNMEVLERLVLDFLRAPGETISGPPSSSLISLSWGWRTLSYTCYTHLDKPGGGL